MKKFVGQFLTEQEKTEILFFAGGISLLAWVWICFYVIPSPLGPFIFVGSMIVVLGLLPMFTT